MTQTTERPAREFTIPYYVNFHVNFNVNFNTSDNEKRTSQKRERTAQIFVQPKLPNFLLAAMAVTDSQRTQYAH